MNSQIMKIFYGADLLPYKDEARSVHYPIIGNSFNGASNVTEIRFYVDRIGGAETATWMSIATLPNGKKGYKLLESYYDSYVGEYYVVLPLTKFYTQAKGDVYICINGYAGGSEIVYDSEDETYKIEGDPIIQATGSIKLSINYAPTIVESDIVEYVSLDDILSTISNYATLDYVNNNAIMLTSFNGNNKTIIDLYNGLKPTSGYKNLFVVILSGISYGGTYIISIGKSGDNYYLEAERYKTTSANVDRDRFVYGGDGTALVNQVFIPSSSNVYYQPYALISEVSDLDTTLRSYIDDNFVTLETDQTITGTKFFNNFAAKRLLSKQSGTSGTSFVLNLPQNSGTLAREEWVSDNFYTKSQTNTQIANAIESVKANEFQVVSSLPATGEEGIIYLIETSSGSGVYNQYIWEESASDYISLGTTAIDLSGYVTTDTDQTIAGYKTFSNGISTQGIHCTGELRGNGVLEIHNGGDDVSVTLGQENLTLYAANTIQLVSDDDDIQFLMKRTTFTFNSDEISSTENTKYIATRTWANTQLATKENVSNKVTSLNASSTDTQYPSAKCVYDNLKNVREVAEGKCQTVIISCNDNYASVREYLGEHPQAKIWHNGEDVTSDFYSGNYWYNRNWINEDFNEPDSEQITPLNDVGEGYLLCKYGNQLNQQYVSGDYFIVFIGMQTMDESDLHVGDIILVEETGVPDRWFNPSNYGSFDSLEIYDEPYVKETRTIAGINLSSNISAQSLTDNLVYMNNTTDIDYVMED